MRLVCEVQQRKIRPRARRQPTTCVESLCGVYGKFRAQGELARHFPGVRGLVSGAHSIHISYEDVLSARGTRE